MNTSKVPAVENAIRILHHIATKQGDSSSSALARKLGASQPTTYRILKTLETADWIKSNGNGGYTLSVGLLPLLTHLDDFSRYSRTARSIIESLSARLDLTVKFSIRQSLEQIIVCTAIPRKPFGVSVPLGGRYPIVWGSPGACLLAELSDQEVESIIAAIPKEKWKHETPELVRKRLTQVRSEHICESFGEHYLGIDTISTPINTPSTPATLTLVALRGEMTSKNIPRFRKELIDARKEVEQALQHA